MLPSPTSFFFKYFPMLSCLHLFIYLSRFLAFFLPFLTPIDPPSPTHSLSLFLYLSLHQFTGEVNIEDVDEDLVEYINSLRVAILEAYTGIIQGLKEAKKQDSVIPALETIVELLERSTNDEQKSEEVLKAAVGLLGDLGQIFGNKMANVYRMPFVKKVFIEGLETEDSSINDTAKWAQSIAHNMIISKN